MKGSLWGRNEAQDGDDLEMGLNIVPSNTDITDALEGDEAKAEPQAQAQIEDDEAKAEQPRVSDDIAIDEAFFACDAPPPPGALR